jgi:riboflavin biosynthesis pyrimidine reductase
VNPTRAQLFDAYAFADRTAPRLRTNFVSSIDGAVTLGGVSGSLGGATDRRVMAVLRAMADVILVGAGTVRVEGYGGMRPATEDAAWRRAHGLSDAPRLAVVSGDLGLAPSAPFFAEASTPPLVLTRSRVPQDRRDALARVAEVVSCGDDEVDLGAVVAELNRRGSAQILCEGGPHLFGSLLDAHLVDEACVTLAPRLVGGDAGRIVQGAVEEDRRFALAGSFSDDEGFLFLRYVAEPSRTQTPS